MNSNPSNCINAALILVCLLTLLSSETSFCQDLLSRDQLIEMLDSPVPRTRGLVVVKDDGASTGDQNPGGPMTPPKVMLNIQFDFDSSKLSERSIGQLNELGEALNSNVLSEFTFEIAGHTDARGRTDYNRALSLRRAEAVRDYLTSQLNVSASRLQARGWGEDRPIRPENPEHPDNRRVEIINLGSTP